MATEEIRGLSVKFDADFSDFKKNLRSADKDINSTQKQLKSLQDSLKIDWDAKKFQRAQQEAQKALDATEKKADLLRKRMLEMEEAGVTDKNRAEYNYLAEQLEKTELNATRLRKQLEELDDLKLKNLTKGLDDAAEKLDKAANKTRAISTAATAAIGGLVALGLTTVQQADDIATLATKYDMSTDAIQRFNYVALQTDTQAEDLYKAFVKVQGGVADLQTGISSVNTMALQQLGLEFDKFSGKEEQFYAIIDALAGMEDQAKMTSLANDIFGEKMATNLFPLIYSGTEAINEYRQEFEAMGSLTEEQVLQLAEFDNVLNRLKTQYINLGLTLGESLLPLMEEFSDILVQDLLPVLREWVRWFSELDRGQQKTLLSLLLLTAAISPFLSGASKAVSSISGLIQMLSKLEMSTVATMGKWLLLTAAISALIAVIANWSNMNTVQKVIGLLGALSAAALATAVAFGVFHSAWSMGIAVAGIVAGIATATAAVIAAGKQVGSQVSFNTPSGGSAPSYTPSYSTPKAPTSSSTVNNATNNYQDNSVINITIEKNEYMSEEDIIQAVNKGLKLAKQSRT